MGALDILYIFGVTLVTFTIFSDGKENCGVCGYYRRTTDPKIPELDELWIAMGFSDESRKLLSESTNVTVQISKVGKKYTVETKGNKCGDFKYSFKSGEEFNLRLCDGRKIPTTVELNERERKLTYTLNFPEFEGTIVARHKDKDLVYAFAVKDKEAEEHFVQIDVDTAAGAAPSGGTIAGSVKKVAQGNKPASKKSSKAGSDEDEKRDKTKANVALLPISVEI